MSRRRRNDTFGPTVGPGRAFLLASVVTALSGAAGLSHELLWTRRLTDLLGTSVEASARVFGCFFLGLTLGSALASNRAGRIGRSLRTTAMAEFLVAVLSIPILLLPEWTGWIWPTMGPDRLTGTSGWALKWLISLVVVLPPASAMGAVLPMLAAVTLGGPRVLGRHGVWLYAANTLGGVAGLIGTSLLSLPTLGVTGSMLLAMVVNLGIAVILVRADRSPPLPSTPARVTVEPPETCRRRGLPEAVALLSGAGVLACEVIALELVMLAAPFSFYAPAAVLTSVICALGLASLIVPYLRSRAVARPSRLPLVLTAGGLALTAAPLLFMTLATTVGPLAGDSDILGFFLRLVTVTMACLGPALLFIGQIFPEALAMRGSGDEAGRFGRLLAWNGAGGFLGAEVGYRLIIPCCGIHGGMAALGLAYLVAGLGAEVATSAWRDMRGKIRAAAALVFGTSLAFGFVGHLPHVNPFLGFAVLDQRFGREGAVAVVEKPSGARSILLSNQYILGGTDARWDQERQAHLPLLMHPEPRRVAFIGLATGITPGAALEHPEVSSITAVEVSPLVAQAADRWFAEWNHSVTGQPRVEVVIEDGRTYLASCTDRFDVVVGDLYLPWGPGESRLFSVEHFTSARNALRSGGLFCQWLPLYQLTPTQFDLILATFRKAFPRVHLIRNGFETQRPTLGLIGFRDGELDWGVVGRRCSQSREAGTLADPVTRHVEAMAMLYAGVASGTEEEVPINTLGNLRLELDAGRERVLENPGGKYLHGERYLEWLRERLDTAFSRPGTGFSGEPPMGRKPTAWQLGYLLSRSEQERLMHRRERGAGPGTMPDELARLLPESILSDTGADWARWPGSSPLPTTMIFRNQVPFEAPARRFDGGTGHFRREDSATRWLPRGWLVPLWPHLPQIEVSDRRAEQDGQGSTSYIQAGIHRNSHHRIDPGFARQACHHKPAGSRWRSVRSIEPFGPLSNAGLFVAAGMAAFRHPEQEVHQCPTHGFSPTLS